MNKLGWIQASKKEKEKADQFREKEKRDTDNNKDILLIKEH